MKANYRKYTLQFKCPSGTSRGMLTTKDSWIIILEKNKKIGIGECGLLKGLSYDDIPAYEFEIRKLIDRINHGSIPNSRQLQKYPSIRFGLEMALLDLNSHEEKILFPSDFTRGTDSISINGLVWMGDFDFMKKQIGEKMESGYSCIKLKIGALDFEDELNLIRSIRKQFSSNELEVRVDANGAFHTEDAIDKLNRLSEFDIHSIEQPIKQGQWEEMARLAEKSPIPIALDEELIGMFDKEQQMELLNTIQPQYIILKPSLLGGYSASQQWIDLAEENNISWWVTSALESNIGLNAIAQWTYTLRNKMPQGLGTGQLYSNNFDSPLKITRGFLHFDPDKKWNMNHLYSSL